MSGRTALVFAGQGAQRKGMGLDFLNHRKTPGWRTWLSCQDALREGFGFDITTVIRDDPPSAVCAGKTLKPGKKGGGMLSNTVFTQPALVTFQTAAYAAFREANPNAEFQCVAGHSLGEFSALAAIGVLEPAVAAKLVCRRGQIMTDAIEPLTTRRLVDDPIVFPMFAVNPKRANIDAVSVDRSNDPADATSAPTSSSGSTSPSEREERVIDDVDAVVLEMVELIAQAVNDEAWSMLELVNYNVRGEQLVVAGDRISLSALGKCLDPQWRATIATELGVAEGGRAMAIEDLVSAAVAECTEDRTLGVAKDPNAPQDLSYVPGSRKKNIREQLGIRQHATIDGGQSKLEVQLDNFSRQGDGRSGLKKKSWFMPLELAVPFHSSVLRRGLDALHDELLQALPADDVVRETLNATSGRPRWITNVTASAFDAESTEFREQVLATLGAMNVGEQAHAGRMVPASVPALIRAAQEGSARELLAAVCAIQLCRTVQWADSMETIVAAEGCTRLVEVTPVPTLTGMFKRAGLFVDAPDAAASSNGGGLTASAQIPADTEKLKGWHWE